MTEVLDMDNINEVIETISIGLFIASFLLNTYRVPNAIDLCHECLRVFKNHAGILEDELAILITRQSIEPSLRPIILSTITQMP